VVGEHGVHAEGHGQKLGGEEVAFEARGGALVQLGNGELRGTVDGPEKVEIALLDPDLGDVDVGVADGVGPAAPRGGLVAIDLG